MKYLTKPALFLGVLGALALVAPGCGGNGQSSSNGGSSSGGGGAGGNTGGSTGGTGGSTGGTTSTGGTGGNTGGTGGTGGGSSDNGAPGSAFVNAGGRAKSQNYQMVFTLGQSTPNQSRLSSSNYKMQGGIIGATGSFK